MLTIAVLAALLTANPLADQDAAASSLVVKIVCLESRAGVVRVALFDSAESHLGKATDSGVVSAAQEQPAWSSKRLAAGDYSLAIYHDVNENGRLDRNLVGWPKEPYGFSNDLRIRFGPPKWTKAKFEVDGAAEVAVCVE